MTVRGRLANIPKNIIDKKEEIVRLYYVDGIKQQEIKKDLV